MEEEKELERKNKENQKKQLQREKAQIKREKEEEFLRDPLKRLTECAGKKNEAKETQFSVTMICRRCGKKIGWQTYND